MDIFSRRHWYTETSTISEVFFNDETARVGYFLEDRVRAAGVKVQNETAIPAGRYEVIIDRSERFSLRASLAAGHPVDVFLPRLLNVPMFNGIRIHGGNKATDTEGCLILGTWKSVDLVGGGRLYLPSFMSRIKKALDAHERVFSEISDEPIEDTRLAA